MKTEPGIKQEPGTLPPNVSYPSYNGIEKNSVAANRAAQQLQAQYGMRAQDSINAIQQGRMGQSQQPGQQPGQPSGPVLPQLPQQQPSDHHQQPLGNAQVDGAGDDFIMEDPSDEEQESFEGVLVRHGVSGKPEELGRVEIDRILHDQMAAKAKSMEGGGLMLSLKEATKNQPKSKKLRSKGKGPAGVAAYDGVDDDDDVEVDEDAINSDLDDPDEDRDDDEVDDEGLGHIMLCMYDKVQRVKNKWYVSKDELRLCSSVEIYANSLKIGSALSRMVS